MSGISIGNVSLANLDTTKIAVKPQQEAKKKLLRLLSTD